MSANRIFAVIFILVLFFLSISTVALAFLDGNFTELPSMLWEEKFFAQARAMIDKGFGIVRVDDVYISDNALIKITSTPDEDITESNIHTLKTVTSSVSMPVYTMIVPTANVILQNQLPSYASIWDQNEYIDNLYSSLVSSSVVVPSYDTLFVNNSKEIFYRTSDNLTPLGGYYLYSNLSQKLGFYPQKLDDFNVEYYASDYFGELFETTGYRNIKGDNITFYRSAFYDSNITMSVYDNKGSEAVFNDIYVKTASDNLLLCYPGGTFPVTNIENKAVDGNKLLIISDKTVKSVVGFLVDNYELVTIINPFAETSNYTQMLDLDEYDQILFLFSVDTFGHRDLSKIFQIVN